MRIPVREVILVGGALFALALALLWAAFFARAKQGTGRCGGKLAVGLFAGSFFCALLSFGCMVCAGASIFGEQAGWF